MAHSLPRRLKLIQCGLGGFGRSWLEIAAASPAFEIAAIVELDPEQLRQVAEEFSIPPQRRFTDLDAALEKAEADAVLSVTPPPVHVVHARTAFSRGLHFLTEKPLAGNIADAREMVSLAETAGLQLSVSQQYRFKPPAIRIRELLAESVVGPLGHGDVQFYIPADFTGTFRETMRYPLLIDMAIHHIDLVRAFSGREIERVTALSMRPSWSWYAHEPALKMLVELEGGLAFSYSGDWSARGRRTGWSGNWRLQCAEGALLLENECVFVSRSERGWSEEETVEEIDLGAPSPTERDATLAQFAAAIRTGVPTETSGRDNIRSLAAVLAAERSAEGRRPVRLDELL